MLSIELFKGFQGFNDPNEFDAFAELIIENGTISLIHNNHRFIRDRADNDRSYWRCRHSFKFNCKARVVTTVKNGYEMMKIRNAEHNHTEIKRKKGRKKKLKQQTRKSKIMPTIIRPMLSSDNIPPPLIRLMPKLTPKTPALPEVNKSPPDNDTENTIVDIID